MIRIIGVHRSDDAHVVDALSDLRQQLANRQSALTAIPKTKRHRHQTACFVFRPKLNLLRPLPDKLIERGLRIKEVRLKRATIHKELNHPLGPRSMMRSR